MIFNSFNHAYYSNLHTVFDRPNKEFFGHQFTILDPSQNTLENPPEALKYNLPYFERFYDWIMSGSLKTEDLIKLSPKAANFPIDYEGNSTAYGPRILTQIEDVIYDLKTNPGTRQACIMILSAEDQEVRKGRREGKTKMEYPCTFGLNFYIREGELNCHVIMRSNNYCVTVCLDVYLFTRLQRHIAVEVGVGLGYYQHYAVNAHVVPNEEDRAFQILESHFQSRG
jgi:hypothetical protein